ncbi:insulin-like growth factor-binding protein 1 [Falco biarmicus]|uniref:Insulin-like growth factor-binding protein 1 n=1 Tax=Falco tinnunculus TaxID=100819 RepID=A0A8C4UPE4_FALTI|nr:insulin-like growth factor-binding protein 1 [Falco naumanni]XP_055565592.1 insulin-like growth factor-binding protein 1 [Falco cherrug]XP_056193843.1 insulin-like growth factor-binding protein 1 [Falco biarmicus]
MSRLRWLLSLLLPPLLLAPPLGPRPAAGAAPPPLRCAPCPPQQLALCPPVPPACPEPARPPGCGCCQTCALGPGQPCGVYTARCRQGLRCHGPPGDPRPLSALLRGQGTCLPAGEAAGARTAEPADSMEPDDTSLESAEMTQDQLLNYQLMSLISQDKPIPWNAITAYENMKAKRLSELKKWKEQGPCQKELYRALYKLAKAQQRSGGEIYKFYLPNCNKNGFYHSKQCETSLDGETAGCWCVYPKTGRRIPGSSEMKGDPECQQYVNSQE